MADVTKVAYATGSRADYGIVRRYLSLLNAEPGVDLSVLATGSMLDRRYGAPVSLVEEDGLRVGARVPLPLGDSSSVGTARAMAVALDGFAALFAADRPDLLIVLGDRYEMLSVATAAAMQAIPILHIHGGEATFGNYDEFIRHSITKMSRFHFTATEEYRRRVVQLGEDPSTVFNLGALGAENCVLDAERGSSEGLVPPSPDGYFVVLFHPETLSGADPASQVRELLAAADRFPGCGFAFIGANADTRSETLRAVVKEYVRAHASASYHENLRPEDYHALVRGAAALVGNSSSGIIEAPSLGTRTVNIGHRQDGRARGASVADVPCEADAIERAMRDALERPGCDPAGNPYYREGAAAAYLEKTLGILKRPAFEPKRFFDVGFDLEGASS